MMARNDDSRARAAIVRFVFTLCVAMLGSAISSGARAADTDCVADNGKTQCTSPIFGDWSFAYCYDGGSYVGRDATWCHVRNGFWDTSIPGCVGGTPVTDGNFDALATQVETSMEGACQGTMLGSRVGWGATVSSVNCWSGSTTYKNGQPVSQLDVDNFTYLLNNASGAGCDPTQHSLRYVLLRQRELTCPQGYQPIGTDPLRCVLPTPACAHDTVGNPIGVCNGVKRQHEVDYRSPGPGGLEFVRYYNSTGRFSVDDTPITNDDYWRNSYSSRIVLMPGVASVLAAVQRFDGTVKYFDINGNDIHNEEGGQFRLVKLTDGSGATTGWQMTTPESDVESYDALGRLVSIRTRAGFTHTVGYDSNGHMASVTDDFGRALSFAYDSSGRLATMTDPGNHTYQYGYDSVGRLSTVTYPDGKTRTYVYEDPNWPFALTGVVDERGSRFATYGYDSTGRANLTEHAGYAGHYSLSFGATSSGPHIIVTDAFGTTHTSDYVAQGGLYLLTQRAISGLGTESRTYDVNGNVASVTDRRGYKTTYVYDLTRNLETSRTEAYGTTLARTIATTWNPTYRLPATITEPSGVAGVNLVTEFTYDANGNLTQKKETTGTSTREWDYTVNGRGQVLTIDGPRTDVSDVTTFTYYSDNDPCGGCRGQVYTITDPASHVTTFTSYDADGRPTQIMDANGVVTTLTYKPRGWLESRTTAGETTTYDYDAVGNLSKVTMPDGSWVHYLYDAANGLVSVDDALGNVIEYELDVMGNRVQESVYDPQGALKRTMQRVYDGMNRLQRQLGAASQTTSYAYDNNSNLTTATDPLFHSVTNTYDALNRLTNITDPANGNTVFTYDAKDHLKTVKDPKLSATTTYNYDGLGNLTSQVSPDTGNTSFTYDSAGNVLTQTDARNVATTYTYDSLNRVTAATVADGTVTYEYDNTTTGGPYAIGRLTKVTDPSGSTTYTYDSLGRVTSKAQTVIANPANKDFTVAYTYANGRQAGITYPSGRAVTYGFDLDGRVSSITVDGTTNVLSSARYFPFGGPTGWTWGNGEPYLRAYDMDGRLSTITIGPAAGTYPDLSETFSYDSLNRLLGATLAAGQTQSFTYDANGNRTNATINAASTTYTYPTTSHRLSNLTGSTTRSFTYDNAGNLTASAGITYAYDGRGRMKQAGTATYAINGLGQRVKKNNGTDVFFAYDEAGHLIGEYDTTGAPIEETVWLGDLPVAVLKPNATSFDVFYIWSDNLGAPREITDTVNQERWEWPNADPFGNIPPNENPAGLGTFTYNLRFPGQYYDAEKASNYNNYRDYDPSIGRYVESDPIGLVGGINTYAYVYNRPLVLQDWLGLAPIEWWNNQRGRGGLSGPTYGTWGGGCWSGGQYSCKGADIGNAAPTDSADACYMHHDKCYDRCKSSPDPGKCKAECDGTLCKELQAIGPVQNWAQPPYRGTAGQADIYRSGAMLIFCPRPSDSGGTGAAGRRY